LIEGLPQSIEKEIFSAVKMLKASQHRSAALLLLCLIRELGARPEKFYSQLVDEMIAVIKPDTAVEYFEDLCEANPDDISAHLFMGYLIWRAKGLDAAISYYRTLEGRLKVEAIPRRHLNGMKSLRTTHEIQALLGSADEPSLSAEKIKIAHELPGGVGPVIFTSADPRYLAVLGNLYFSSIRNVSDRAHVHIMIVNGSEADERQLQSLAHEYNVHVTYHLETSPANVGSYCINRRYLIVHSLMKYFDRGVLVTDFDFIFRENAPAVFSAFGDCDWAHVSATLRMGYKLPWERVDGNFVYFARTPNGERLAAALSRMTASVFVAGANQTHFDQGLLFCLSESAQAVAPGTTTLVINKLVSDLSLLYLQSSGTSGGADAKRDDLLRKLERTTVSTR
jgi:hypothetical protein